VRAGVAAAVIGVAFLALYGATMRPGVGWGDTSELALAVECHGIPHSPGFVLFVLLGRAVKIAGGLSGARAASWVAASSAAAASALLAGSVAARWGTALGLAGGICLGASPLVWAQATQGEVYTLSLVFATALLCLSMRPSTTRSALAAGYVWGLAVGNHPSTIALFPMLIPFARRHCKAAMGGFVAALSLLLVLPLRSQHYPCLDWGETRTFRGLLWLVSLQEFRTDALAGQLLAGGSLHGAVTTAKSFLRSASSPMALGLGLAALPVVLARMPSIVLSGALLVILTTVAGGGPDVFGYLAPLCLLIVFTAIWGITLLPVRRPAAAVVMIAAATLLVMPETPQLDRSLDESAEAYQRALAAQLHGGALFTDSSTDLFLMLHHAWTHGLEPKVVYTPYLGHEWYRRTLDRSLVRFLPVRPDPPYPMIVRAARAAGFEPRFTFSDLPEGARGVLIPDGWILRGGAYDETSDESAIQLWPESQAVGPQGGSHRALRLAQGAQLLVARGEHALAAPRLAGALRTDPGNRAVWLTLVDAYANMNDCDRLAESATAGLRCGPWSVRDAEALARGMDALRTPCPAATAVMESISVASPRNTQLAVYAARRALTDGAPRSVLRILAPFAQTESADVMNLRGVALMLLKDYAQASASLRLARELSDQASKARISANLALCLRLLELDAEADSIAMGLGDSAAAKDVQ